MLNHLSEGDPLRQMRVPQCVDVTMKHIKNRSIRFFAHSFVSISIVRSYHKLGPRPSCVE